jgi:hypothetical protein
MHEGTDMASDPQRGGGWRGSPWRIAAWGTAALVLLLPLVAMQFTAEVDWDGADFIFAGVLICSVGLTYELAVRKTSSAPYRAGVAVALAAAFLLVWATGAVGIIGSERNPANLMYGGVLAVATIGAVIARFRPRGLAFAMASAGLVQALVGGIALAAGLGVGDPSWPFDILGATGFFTALWLLSARLFLSLAKRDRPNGTVGADSGTRSSSTLAR